MRVITYNVWAGVWWKPDIVYDKKRKTKLFATLSQLIDEDAEVLIALQEIWTKKLAYTLKHNYRSTHHTLFTTKESSHMPLGVFLYGLALALLPGIVAGVLIAVQVPGWVLALSVALCLPRCYRSYCTVTYTNTQSFHATRHLWATLTMLWHLLQRLADLLMV